MDLKNVIAELTEVSGASGSESPAAAIALDMLKKFCPDAAVVNGNVTGHFGDIRSGRPSLVLDAHIDQIGMIVTKITDQGFIKVGNLGGIDRRLLPAQPVIIHGKKDIPGVICSVPPHLSSGSSSVLTFDKVAIDTGMTREELESLIEPGDTITFYAPCRSLVGTRITSGALDDRCGIAAILRALELLQGKDIAYNVTVIFSAQEELGERGAKIGAFAADPDIAIAVDVSFAYAISEDENKCGYLGKGPMIGISPCLDRELSDQLIGTARTAGIDFQHEVMNDLTSTNADQYSVSRCGARAGTVSIPLRNMHTPAEVIDIKDVELTAMLLAEFIKEGK